MNLNSSILDLFSISTFRSRFRALATLIGPSTTLDFCKRRRWYILELRNACDQTIEA